MKMQMAKDNFCARGEPVALGVVLVVVAGFLLAPGVARAERVLLKPRLEAGSEFVVKTETDARMGLPMGGPTGEQTVETEARLTTRVLPHEDQESKVVSVKYDYMKMEMVSPMMRMSYDSRRPDSKDAVLGASFNEVVGKEFTLVYDKEDKFVTMELPPAIEQAEGSAPFGQEIGPEQIVDIVRSSMGHFPERTVAPGDSWDHVMKIPMPGVGEFSLDVRYVYRKDGVVDGRMCAIVDFSGAASGEFAPDVGATGEAGEDVTLERRADAGLEDAKMAGTIAFDAEIGLARTSEMELKMTMRMPSPLGAESELKIPMVQKSRTRLESYSEIQATPARSVDP